MNGRPTLAGLAVTGTSAVLLTMLLIVVLVLALLGAGWLLLELAYELLFPGLDPDA